jgi:hypothetical protein
MTPLSVNYSEQRHNGKFNDTKKAKPILDLFEFGLYYGT